MKSKCKKTEKDFPSPLLLCCYQLELLVKVTLQQALESLAVAGLVQ